MLNDLVAEQSELQKKSKYAIFLDATWSNYTDEMRELYQNLVSDIIKKLGYNPLYNYAPFSNKNSEILMFDDDSNLLGLLHFTIERQYTIVPRFSPSDIKPEKVFENNDNVFYIEYIFSFGKGNGQKMMGFIKKYADKYDVAIGLEGSVVEKSEGKYMASAKHLQRFYEKQGFVNTSGNYYLYTPNSMAKGGNIPNSNMELLAPNGNKSNLNHEQWHLVRTPQFKQWFGDWEKLAMAKIKDSAMDEVTLANISKDVSKVVDENGEPLVVYHGTKHKFTSFDLKHFGKTDLGFFGQGFYFSTDKGTAEAYASISEWDKIQNTFNENGSVLQLFLNLKNPIIVKTKIDFINASGKREIREGYDGKIVIPNSRYSANTEYVTFNPNQIKLADGTNTTFDGNNDDIRFKNGGGIEFVPEKKGTLIKGNEIIKYFEKVNGNYRLIFYTLNETKGKVPIMCHSFGYCQELDSENVTPKELVELIKKNNLMEKGGELKREDEKKIKDAIRYVENSPKARMNIDFEDEENVQQAINDGKDYERIFPLKSKANSFIVKKIREGVKEKYISFGTWNEKKKSYDYKYFKNERYGDKSKEYDTLQIATYDNEGKIVGIIRIATSENKKEEVKIGAFKISVRQDYQNKGIASKLIEKAESEGIDFVEALKNNNFTSKGRWYFISWLNKKLKKKKYSDGGEIEKVIKSKQKPVFAVNNEQNTIHLNANFLLNEIDRRHREKYNNEDIKTGLAKQYAETVKDRGEKRAISNLEFTLMNYIPTNVQSDYRNKILLKEYDKIDDSNDDELKFDSNYRPLFWHLTEKEFCDYAENYEVDTRLEGTKAKMECKDFYKYAVILPLLHKSAERNVFLLAVETGQLPYDKAVEIITNVGEWKETNKFVAELIRYDADRNFNANIWLQPKDIFLSSDYFKNNFTKAKADKWYSTYINDKIYNQSQELLIKFIESGIVTYADLVKRVNESNADVHPEDFAKIKIISKKAQTRLKLKALRLILDDGLVSIEEFKTQEDMANDIRTYTDAFQPDVERRIAQAKKENEEIQKEELKDLSKNEYDLFKNAINRVPNIDLKRTIEIAEKIAKLDNGTRKEHLEYFAEAIFYTITEAEGEYLDIYYLDDLNSLVGLSGTDFSSMSRKIEIGVFNKEKTELISNEIKKYKIAQYSFKKMDNKKQHLIKNYVSKFPIDYQRDHVAIKKELNDVSNFINNYKDSTISDFVNELIKMTSKWEENQIDKDDEEIEDFVDKRLNKQTPNLLLPENERIIVESIINQTKEGKLFNKSSLEKLGKEHGITNQNLVKELAELAVSFMAKAIASNSGMSTKERYEKIVGLYKNQSNLSHRTSQSIMFQQYSTPAPIGYLAGLFCGFNKQGNYFEPSAGNGLLTTAGNPSNFIVNEIDDVRNRNLKVLGFSKVLKQDATNPFVGYEKSFDGIITNPPFGTTEGVAYGNTDIKSLEQLMCLRALDTMKDNGRGALIIGGHLEYDKAGRIKAGKNRSFFVYLYRNYNVLDVINIDGQALYSRQGTSFNVRLILIDGRKEIPNGYPLIMEEPLPVTETNSYTPVKSFETLWDRVNKSM